MPILLKNDKSCLFIHIPKTGGSNFLKTARAGLWRIEMSISGLRADQLRMLKCAPQHYHWELIRQVVRPERFDRIIAITRHPFSRFVSEYGWQKAQGLTDLSMAAWAEKTLEDYAADPYTADNHIRPQCEFIPESLPAKAEIFRLENKGVARAFREISTMAAPPARRAVLDALPVSGRSSSIKALPADLEQFREDLQSLYGRDFNRFGYDVYLDQG